MDLQIPSAFKWDEQGFAGVGDSTENQELYVIQWLSRLEEEAMRCPVPVLEVARGGLERELLRLVCSSQPRPTRLIRDRVARCYLVLYSRAKGHVGGMLAEVLNALASLLATGKAAADQGPMEASLAAIHCISVLVGRFSRNRRLSEKEAADLVKFLKAEMSPHRYLVAVVQNQAALCLELVLVHTRFGHPFRRSIALPLIQALIRAIEAPPVPGDTIREVQDAGARLAGTLGSDPQGGGGGSQTRTEDKDLRALSLDEMLKQLSVPLKKLHNEAGNTYGEIRERRRRSSSLLLQAYGEMCGRLGGTWTARHYGQIVRHILDEVLRSYDSVEKEGEGSEADLIEAEAEGKGAALYIEVGITRLFLRIGRQWLPDATSRSDGLHELIRSWLRAWPAILPGERAPGPRTLRREEGGIGSMTGSGLSSALIHPPSGGTVAKGATTVSTPVALASSVENLLLKHPRWSVQAAACTTLVSVVRASPNLLPPLTQGLHKHLQGHLTSTSGTAMELRRIRGTAAGLAVLVTEGPAHPLVVGEGGDAWVFALVHQLLRSSHHRGHREAGWLLVGALARTGPRRLQPHLTPLLLLCKDALPRPSRPPADHARGEEGKPDDLEGRILALGAIREVLRSSGSLVGIEVGRRILSLLHNSWAALAGEGEGDGNRTKGRIKALLLECYGALVGLGDRVSRGILRLEERGGTQPWVQTVVRASLDTVIHAEGLNSGVGADRGEEESEGKGETGVWAGHVTLTMAAHAGMASSVWSDMDPEWQPILKRSVTWSPGWMGVLGGCTGSTTASLSAGYQAVDGAIIFLGSLLPLLYPSPGKGSTLALLRPLTKGASRRTSQAKAWMGPTGIGLAYGLLGLTPPLLASVDTPGVWRWEGMRGLVREPSDRAGMTRIVGGMCGGMLGPESARSVLRVLEALGRDPHRSVSTSALAALASVVRGSGSSYSASVSSSSTWCKGILGVVVHALSHSLPLDGEGMDEEGLGQGAGRVLEAIIEIMGPDLSHGGSLLKTCTLLANELWRMGLRQSMSRGIRCLEHCVIFAPGHVEVRGLASRLHALLPLVPPYWGEGPGASETRRVVLGCLGQLVRRDLQGVWEAGGFKDEWITLLLAMTDWEEEDRVVGSRVGCGTLLKGFIEEGRALREDTAEWVKRCVDVLLARGIWSGAGSNNEVPLEEEREEEEGEEDSESGPGKEERVAPSALGLYLTGPVRGPSQWLALRVMRWLVEEAATAGTTKGSITSHMDPLLAKSSPNKIVTHVGDLIRTSLGAATTGDSRVRREGLLLLRSILTHFAEAIDPEGLMDDDEEEEEVHEPRAANDLEDEEEDGEVGTSSFQKRKRHGTPLLAQYQAQITAAITPALSKDKSASLGERAKAGEEDVRVVALAVQVAAQYIGAGIVKETRKMGRVLRLLDDALTAIARLDQADDDEEEQDGMGEEGEKLEEGKGTEGKSQKGEPSVVEIIGAESAPASLLLKVSVLQGWARLYILYKGLDARALTVIEAEDEEEEEDDEDRKEHIYGRPFLGSVLEPRLATLGPLWVRSLEEYGKFRLGVEEEEEEEESGGVGSGGGEGNGSRRGSRLDSPGTPKSQSFPNGGFATRTSSVIPGRDSGQAWIGVSSGVRNSWGRSVYEGGGGSALEGGVRGKGWIELLAAASSLPTMPTASRSLFIGLMGMVLVEGLDRLDYSLQLLLLSSISRVYASPEGLEGVKKKEIRAVKRELIGLLDRTVLTLPGPNISSKGARIVEEVFGIVRSIWVSDEMDQEQEKEGDEEARLRLVLHAMAWGLPPGVMGDMVGQGQIRKPGPPKIKGVTGIRLGVRILVDRMIHQGGSRVQAGVVGLLVRLIYRASHLTLSSEILRQLARLVGADIPRLAPVCLSCLIDEEKKGMEAGDGHEAMSSFYALVHSWCLQASSSWGLTAEWSKFLGRIQFRLNRSFEQKQVLLPLRALQTMLMMEDRFGSEMGRMERTGGLLGLMWCIASRGIQEKVEEMKPPSMGMEEWDVILSSSISVIGLFSEQSAGSSLLERVPHETEMVLGKHLLRLASLQPEAFKVVFQKIDRKQEMERVMRQAVTSASISTRMGSGGSRNAPSKAIPLRADFRLD
ncbi:hypothetical protein BJ684DRAFT_15289 [Piptocephalis cylindrospora]|uniref:Armadillo-type protein n=1 Tax=Piptocephalis cylindrospora TaxID=1907219 RepID=A0A4P9Y5R3_9FUNG|nr:hypothetical protein BJ684DRAFT_15289 [Piptocephalis cylindrospora]|eukprot:RKP14378.1 hypothetical protein BJ684DRAFT_15289 [Piptocephalis cylindrospora]